MSFPKAKIQRFNEVKEYTPSPADYNVTLTNKPKSGIITQSERFTDVASSASDSESCQSLPINTTFRTPTLPSKKKKTFLPLSSPKAKLRDMFRRNDPEELKEKIVELQNKNIYIKELTSEIEEMKIIIHDLEQKKLKLDEDKKRNEEDIETLKKQQEELLNELKVKHETQIDQVNNEKIKIDEELQKTKDEYQALRKKNQEEMVELLDNMNKFQKLYDKSVKDNKTEIQRMNEEIMQKEEQLRKLEDENLNLQKKHREETELIQNEYSEKIRNIKQIIVASIKDMQTLLEREKIIAFEKIKQIEEINRLNISDLKQNYNREKLKIMEEYEAKLKLMEENFKEVNLLNDMQTKERITEMEEDWKLKFEEKQKESDAILKECQEISEYNIIHSEIEKNHLKTKLKEAEDNFLKLQKESDEIFEQYTKTNRLYQNLQQKIAAELKEKCPKIEETTGHDLKQLLAEKRTYEITINNSQETIEVLKKRLYDSDRDVEQMKKELASYEEKLIEYESKCCQLTTDLEEMKELNNAKEMELESTMKISEKKIEQVKSKLLKKVDVEFKRALEEHELFNEVYQQLHDQQKLNSEAHVLIGNLRKELENVEKTCAEKERKISVLVSENQDLSEKLENRKDFSDAVLVEIEEKKTEIRQLEEKIESLSQYCEYYKNKTGELETELEEAAEIHKKYIDQSGKYDKLLQKCEQLQKANVENQKKLQEQESLIGPFREQLQAFELERNCLLHETKETASKYAEILGHQNHKQKIKHLIQLKNQNLDLQLKNMELENKVRGYKKNVDKLTKENSELKKCRSKSKLDKENFASPNCSANLSFSSPGPLKEKN